MPTHTGIVASRGPAAAGAAQSPPALPDPRRKERRKRVALGALSIVVVIGLYTLVTSRPDNNPAITPGPLDVIGALTEGFANGNITSAILASLQRIGLGFLIGAGSAVIIGSLIGWYRPIEYLLDPIVEAIRPIPPLAYIPLILIWFGIGEASRVIILTLACFVTCIVNVIAGMKEVPRVYVDAAETMGASRFHIFLTVAVPASLPFIFTGLRIALAAGWTTLVAAELLAAQDGLGFLLQQGRRYFLTDQVVAVICIIGVLAFAIDRLFRTVQTRLTSWSEAAR